MTSQPESQFQAADIPSPVNSALAQEVAAWVVHLARTLKTCRLYDTNNPTVVRFRESLHQELRDLLGRCGAVQLEVTSTGMLFEDVPVYTARSRDDNLAATFHRDGIRRIAFHPGIETGEVDFLLDQILYVTGPSASDDDLVTLLWEADLPSIQIVAVPVEGDVDGGGEEVGGAAEPIPWPAAGGTTETAESGGTSEPKAGADEETRSDDWELLARFGDLDQAFDELESAAIQEMARLQQELESEREGPAVPRAIEIMSDCMATDLTADDRGELLRFLSRLLREAIAGGGWQEAATTHAMILACDPQWSAVPFFDGLAGQASMKLTRRVVAALDAQDEKTVAAFLALVTKFGDAPAEWLMQLLAESQQQRTRRPLARAIAELVRAHPERLLPWMADERWYVVRNVVHILGWIGGDGVAGHLMAAMQHPELRVRREIVAALGGASPDVSRPILMGMLPSAEPRLFTAILSQLSLAKDPLVEQKLIEMLRDDRFHDRTEEERRAVYLALAGQGDAVLASLEEELQRGGLFTRGLDHHWQSVALCIARIGTPAAKEILERGARTFKPGPRKACEQAWASLQVKDE